VTHLPFVATTTVTTPGSEYTPPIPADAIYLPEDNTDVSIQLIGDPEPVLLHDLTVPLFLDNVKIRRIRTSGALTNPPTCFYRTQIPPILRDLRAWWFRAPSTTITTPLCAHTDKLLALPSNTTLTNQTRTGGGLLALTTTAVFTTTHELPDSTLASYSVLFVPTALPGTAKLIMTAQTGFEVSLSTAGVLTLSWDDGGGATTLAAPGTINLNRLNHLQLAFGATTTTIWLNGLSATNIVDPGPQAYSSITVAFGLAGLRSELRSLAYWSRTATQADNTYLYAAGTGTGYPAEGTLQSLFTRLPT